MNNFDHLTLAGIVAILAFFWSVHRDIRSLSDCVSRIEGFLQGRLSPPHHEPAE
ncbi:MAG: hypothetical protein OXH76_20890 [Boseongicola sp.]|nr:hypothetical protein [Boseongicola sp.]